jgi:threonyl-tRNA synthetase
MNCPGAFLIYKSRPRSYRELPLKLSEIGHVHRHELSGVLHGLLRVRAFTQDDAHIFSTLDQLKPEIKAIVELIFSVLKAFDFTDMSIAVSTKPDNAMGTDEQWSKATNALTQALDDLGVSYVIQEGEGAFYGPKIEFVIKDSMDRKWQCGTVQVDFFQAENFDLSYVAPSGQYERPVIIHQAIYGSFERFFAILLEHYKGHLPFWIAPLQIKLLTITDDQKEYARNIAHKLINQGIKAEVDESSDPLSGKIKTAQLEKVPWMAIIGKKEVQDECVTIRYSDGKQDKAIPVDEFIARAVHENSFERKDA